MIQHKSLGTQVIENHLVFAFPTLMCFGGQVDGLALGCGDAGVFSSDVVRFSRKPCLKSQFVITAALSLRISGLFTAVARVSISQLTITGSCESCSGVMANGLRSGRRTPNTTVFYDPPQHIGHIGKAPEKPDLIQRRIPRQRPVRDGIDPQCQLVHIHLRSLHVFQFHHRRSLPVLSGIIVAQQVEWRKNYIFGLRDLDKSDIPAEKSRTVG